MNNRKLYRSTDRAMIAGVSAGIADHLDIPRPLVRLAFLMLTLAGGIGLLAYAILWIAMPKDPTLVIRFEGDDAFPRRSSRVGGLFKVAVAVVAAAIIADALPFFDGEFYGVACVAGLLVGLFFLARNIGGRWFDSERGGLYRSRSNKKVFGVLGGLAERFGIDPTILRVAVVCAVVVSAGVVVPAYILYAMLVPYGDAHEIDAERVMVM